MALFGKSREFSNLFFFSSTVALSSSEAINPMIHSANYNSITERCIPYALRCASMHKSV